MIGQVYALTSLAGATVLVLLHDAQAPSTASRWLAVAVALTFRLLAIPRQHPRHTAATAAVSYRRDSGSDLAELRKASSGSSRSGERSGSPRQQ
jgi:hypothetical protein